MLLTILGLGVTLLQAPGPDSLHLAEALQFARRHRGALAAAGATLSGARAAARQLRTLPNPTGTYTYNQSPPRNAIGVQQSLDWLLRRGGEVALGRATEARASADSLQTGADLDAEVRRSWFAVLAVRWGRSLATAQLAIADSVERVAARRLDAGDISATEYDRLRLEQVLARQTLSHARAAEAAATLQLQRVLAWPDSLGWPPLAGSLADGLDDSLSAPAAVEDLPLVRGARADSAAAGAALRSARAARVPLPSVELGLQWDEPSYPGQGLWLFGVSLPLPLFDRGGAAAAGAAARVQGAQAALTEARLEARRQLRDADVQLAETAIRARLARDSLLPGSSVLSTRAARAYQLGETGVLPLLDALRTEREITAAALGDLLAFQDARANWLTLRGPGE